MLKQKLDSVPPAESLPRASHCRWDDSLTLICWLPHRLLLTVMSPTILVAVLDRLSLDPSAALDVPQPGTLGLVTHISVHMSPFSKDILS